MLAKLQGIKPRFEVRSRDPSLPSRHSPETLSSCSAPFGKSRFLQLAQLKMSRILERARWKANKKAREVMDRLRSPSPLQSAGPTVRDNGASLLPSGFISTIPAQAPAPPAILATTASVVKELLAAARDGSDLFLPLKAALVGVVSIWNIFDVRHHHLEPYLTHIERSGLPRPSLSSRDSKASLSLSKPSLIHTKTSPSPATRAYRLALRLLLSTFPIYFCWYV